MKVKNDMLCELVVLILSFLGFFFTITPTTPTMSSDVILVTGGAGFIGSHTLVELLESNYSVVVIDNLVNSNAHALKRVEEITHKNILATHTVDLVDEEATLKVFEDSKSKGYPITAVIHFAGLQSILLHNK